MNVSGYEWYLARVHYIQDQLDLDGEAAAFRDADSRTLLWRRAALHMTRSQRNRGLFLANPVGRESPARVMGLLCKSLDRPATVEEDGRVVVVGDRAVVTTPFVYFGALEEQAFAVARAPDVWTRMDTMLGSIKRILTANRRHVPGALCYSIELQAIADEQQLRAFLEQAGLLKHIAIKIAGRNIDPGPVKTLIDKLRDFFPGTDTARFDARGRLRLADDQRDDLESLARGGIIEVVMEAEAPLPDGSTKFDQATAERAEKIQLPAAGATDDELGERVREVLRARPDQHVGGAASDVPPRTRTKRGRRRR